MSTTATQDQNPRFNVVYCATLVKALCVKVARVKSWRMQIRRESPGGFEEHFLRILISRLTPARPLVGQLPFYGDIDKELNICIGVYKNHGQDEYLCCISDNKGVLMHPEFAEAREKITRVVFGESHWEVVLDAYWVVTLARCPEDARPYFNNLKNVGAEAGVKYRPIYEILFQAYEEYCIAQIVPTA